MPNAANLRNNRRQVMQRSRRLQYATELYMEMMREGDLNRWWRRIPAQQRYTSFAKFIFKRAGKLNALPTRADKIVEKMIEAYGDATMARTMQRQTKNTVASVFLNNGNARRMALGTANGRRVIVVHPPNGSPRRSPK